jgi:hypothetical protein
VDFWAFWRLAASFCGETVGAVVEAVADCMASSLVGGTGFGAIIGRCPPGAVMIEVLVGTLKL